MATSGTEPKGLVSSKLVGPSGTKELYSREARTRSTPGAVAGTWHANPFDEANNYLTRQDGSVNPWGGGAARTASGMNPATYWETANRYAGAGNTNGGPSGPRTAGGGSFGGGPAGLTQEQFDIMLGLANQGPGQMQYNRWNPSTQFQGTPYQGMDIEPWNDTRYRMMESAMGDAYNQAQGQIGTGYDQVRQNLGTNWDTYNQMRAAQQMTQGPTMPAQVSTLGQNQAAVSEANANMAASDRAFQNYLAANELRANAGQASRRTEADFANQFALDALAAQRIQDELGLGLAEQSGWEDWSQRFNDRRYQDSILGQTWGREDDRFAFETGREDELLNWQGQTETDRFNFENEEEARKQRQKDLLELVASAGHLNINPAMFGL